MRGEYSHPYAVRPHEDGSWAVWVFDEGVNPVVKHDTKEKALDDAKDFARKQNRPGVVVFDKDNSFVRFDSNDRFWEVKSRGMRQGP